MTATGPFETSQGQRAAGDDRPTAIPSGSGGSDPAKPAAGPRGTASALPASADVVVVGGGAAGAMAALAAADAGAGVVLVRRAYGATALSSGCIDLGTDPRRLPGDGFRPERRAALAERIETLARTRPEHPLSVGRTSAADLCAAVEFLRERMPFLGAAAPDQPGRIVATTAGTWRETGAGEAGILRGDLVAAAAAAGGTARRARIVVVGLAGAGWTDPVPVARGLETALAAESLVVTVTPLWVEFLRRPSPSPEDAFAIARALDAEGEGARLGAAVARALAAAGGEPPALVLLPPLVGLDRSAEALAALETAAGVRSAEMATAPPSVPGLRFQRALDAALARARVPVVTGAARGEVAPARPGLPARVEAVVLEPGGGRIDCGELVIATGKFIGGGVVKEPTGAFLEPVIGLRISDGRGADPALEPSRFTGHDVLGEHEVFAYGVRTDAELRPLDAGGLPSFENVRCAGSLLAGYAIATDGVAMGTALETGLRAGRLAADAARRLRAEASAAAKRFGAPR